MLVSFYAVYGRRQTKADWSFLVVMPTYEKAQQARDFLVESRLDLQWYWTYQILESPPGGGADSFPPKLTDTELSYYLVMD